MQEPWREHMLYRVRYEQDGLTEDTLYNLKEISRHHGCGLGNYIGCMNRSWDAIDSMYLPGSHDMTTFKGTYPKRLANVAYKTIGKGYETTEWWKKMLETIAANKPLVIECILRFTQKLDWESGNYGDTYSCYWGSNVHARDMLEHAKTWAVQVYHKNGSGPRKTFEGYEYRGAARAWLVPYPWRRYKETGDCDAFLLYNGYSKNVPFSDPTTDIANLIAGRFSMNVQRFPLQNRGYTGNLIYINGEGYVITFGEPCAELKADMDRFSHLDFDIPDHTDDMVYAYS
jgi:hypothetical protein